LSWVLMSTQGVLIGTHGALMRIEGYSRGAPLRSRRSSSCGRGSSSAACTYARTRTRATTPTTAVGSASPGHSSSSQKPGSIGSTRAYPPLHSEDLATSAPQKPTPHLHRDRRHICTGTCRRYHWRDATTAAERDAARAFRNEVLGIHFYEGVVVVEKEPNEHPCFPSQICGPSNTAQYSTQTGTPA
jgi:hypothetical protein